MTGAANSLLALLLAPRFRDVDPVKQLLGCDEARYPQAQECGIRISPRRRQFPRPGPMVHGSLIPLARSGLRGAAHGIPRQSTEVFRM